MNIHWMEMYGLPDYCGENYFILVKADNPTDAKRKLEKRYPDRVYAGGAPEVREDSPILFDADGLSQILVNAW